MPEVPKIFLSASTPDLLSVRQAACDALHAMGYQPVVAEHGQADSGAFWHSLQPVIRECRGVVHVVGGAYGDEPERRQPGEHRRSYAQLEYDLAISLRRPLSIIVCMGPFPFDPYPPEPMDKQRLQQVHRKFVQAGGRAFQFVESEAELVSALTALRVRKAAPVVPVLPPLHPAAKRTAPSALPPQTQFSRRRLFRWVAVGLAMGIIVFIVGVGMLAWIVLRGESPPVTKLLPVAPPVASAPHLATATPARQSSPVPMQRQAAARTPAPPPPRAASPAPVVTPAPMAVPAPPRVAASTPVPVPIVPVPPEHSAANVPNAVQADRSPIDVKTRKAIVERIALAPDIPAEKKEKVREIVNRAHEMRRVLVLPFASGQSVLGAGDATVLNDLVRAPDFANFRDDPTYAFIVLGFADVRGAEDYNLRLSIERARCVRDLLRHDGLLANIIHPVGLGKTTLLDEHQLEKNRIVEVWVIRL